MIIFKENVMLPNELIGHILGFASLIPYFLSYQAKNKKGILILQTGATALACLQYLFLGAQSGFALNIICIIRNIFFYNRDKKFFSGLFFPIFFACLIPLVSIFFWDGWYSALLMIGFLLNTLCLGLCTPQGLRKSLLFTSSLAIVYNGFASSVFGMISESVSIISAAVGLYRYRGSEKKDVKAETSENV